MAVILICPWQEVSSEFHSSSILTTFLLNKHSYACPLMNTCMHSCWAHTGSSQFAQYSYAHILDATVWLNNASPQSTLFEFQLNSTLTVSNCRIYRLYYQPLSSQITMYKVRWTSRSEMKLPYSKAYRYVAYLFPSEKPTWYFIKMDTWKRDLAN